MVKPVVDYKMPSALNELKKAADRVNMGGYNGCHCNSQGNSGEVCNCTSTSEAMKSCICSSTGRSW